jgi:hypothetical protein
MKKILWLDIEAADTKVDRDGAVHQISYIVDVGGEIVAQKSFKCSPFKNDLINMPSLNVCGESYENIISYPPPTIAFKELVNDIHPYKKMVIGGFCNSHYDNPVFFNWWWKCAKELKMYNLKWIDYLHSDPLDVRVLALNKMLDKRDMIFGFKLADVAKLLDIDVEETSLHGAKYDIELTRKIYYSL